MTFLLLETIATMNNTVTIPAGLSGKMYELMLRLNVTNLCVRVLMMTRVCRHVQYIHCIFHLAWPQIKGCRKYNVNSFLFVIEAQQFIL